MVWCKHTNNCRCDFREKMDTMITGDVISVIKIHNKKVGVWYTLEGGMFIQN